MGIAEKQKERKKERNIRVRISVGIFCILLILCHLHFRAITASLSACAGIFLFCSKKGAKSHVKMQKNGTSLSFFSKFVPKNSLGSKKTHPFEGV